MPTSLVHLEMVYPNKRYEAYCFKVPESGPVVQYEPVSNYEMDGLRPRIDLRPRAEVPVYPEDDVDADPSFNEYPAQEEFVEGPDWVPGQIPPKIRSPEYGGGSSDTSLDTQVACAIKAMSVTTTPALDEAVASTSAVGNMYRVELTPLSGLSQQFTLQMEREIQKQIQEQSRKLVQEVLHQSANQVMPPPSSEATRASLCRCFQMALATPCLTPAPPPESEEQSAEESAQYSLADPFAGINLPPPEVLKESCPVSQSSHGRTATHSEPLKANYPPDEKKRRSNSRPRGEAEPKRGHSSGAEPSWNLSHIRGWHSDKAPSQPTREPEAPESMSKPKSVVKKVCLDKAKPINLEDLGPATRSRYNTNGQDWAWWDKSWPHTESSSRSKDDHRHSKPRSSHSDQRSGRQDWNSGQSPNHKSARQKDKSLAAKLIARKEHDKRYKKVVENMMLYLEECYHQIAPADHQLEIHSMRFFGAGAESATIEVLTLIDWATEFLELSRSPVLEILAFLWRLFIVSKKVQFPIPEDPGDAIHKEKCVRTKAQKAWVYLCMLLQFWTDEATTESGEIMYGGWCWPTNPMIVWIRAVLNPSFGEHFQITWASIAASTSWTQAHLYFALAERECFRSEPGPTPDMQNLLEAAVELRWEAYLWEGVQETSDLSYTTTSWAGAAGRLQLPSGQLEARHPTEAESVPPGFTRTQHKTPEEQEYQTPSEASQRQTIHEELGIQDVTTIDESWYPPMEAEVALAVESILDKSQPMDVDPARAEHSYEMFQDDAPELLGTAKGSDSPMTVREDRVLNMPAGFSRAPGDGRLTTGSSAGPTGHKITGRTE